MRKPVISSEISPKFDGVPTTDTLPLYVIMINGVKSTLMKWGQVYS